MNAATAARYPASVALRQLALSRRLFPTLLILGVYCILFLSLSHATEPTYFFSHFAGSRGGPGSADGVGAAAEFYVPYGVAIDRDGNVLVADSLSNAIRKVTPGGIVTTVAGFSNRPGSQDGPTATAQFRYPCGVAVDGTGNIFVADALNHLIRKISIDGQVTTVAGVAGISGKNDGSTAIARFNQPTGIAVASDGTLYVADRYNFVVRKISATNVVSTIAHFQEPSGVAVDSTGNLYVADRGGGLSKISPAGVVTAIASSTSFHNPTGIAVDSKGIVYVASSFSDTIMSISEGGAVSILAGTLFKYGSADGIGAAARFSEPTGVAVNSEGVVYVADRGNSTIRAISPAGETVTLAGLAATPGSSDGTRFDALFKGPTGITGDQSGNIYIADSGNSTIRKISPTGKVSTLAGTVGLGGTIDGTGASARFDVTLGLAADLSGNVFSADFSGLIRKISDGGEVTTFGSSESGNDRLSHLYGIAIDRSGSIYVTDSCTVRKIDPAGTMTTLAGMPGTYGSSDGNGNAAKFNGPSGLCVSRDGNIFVADSGNNTIRRITLAGEVTTIAGAAGISGEVDGQGTVARFYSPNGIAIDSHGNLFVTDLLNSTIRKITPSGAVATIGGLPKVTGRHDGSGQMARFNSPFGIFIDGSDAIYITDSATGSIWRGVPVDEDAANTRLINLSARGYCATGDKVMIGGFVINGNTTKRVLIRGVGPSLVSHGLNLAEVLSDPMIEVHRGAAIVASNDDWTADANAAEIASVGAQVGANALASGDTKSAAIIATLQSGVYTFIARGKGGSSGIVLLEVYDADLPAGKSTFVNIATRAYATTANGVTIGGFVVSGGTPKQVLLRAVGRTLTTQGIDQIDVLADPFIELHQGAAVIAANDNWRDSADAGLIIAAGARVGATPFSTIDSKSSALLVTLQPGIYTLIAGGMLATSGVVLVEVYDAD